MTACSMITSALPKAFKNVTNGIATAAGWLLAANPAPTKLLEDSIGPGFKQDA